MFDEKTLKSKKRFEELLFYTSADDHLPSPAQNILKFISAVQLYKISQENSKNSLLPIEELIQNTPFSQFSIPKETLSVSLPTHTPITIKKILKKNIKYSHFLLRLLDKGLEKEIAHPIIITEKFKTFSIHLKKILPPKVPEKVFNQIVKFLNISEIDIKINPAPYPLYNKNINFVSANIPLALQKINTCSNFVPYIVYQYKDQTEMIHVKHLLSEPEINQTYNDIFSNILSEGLALALQNLPFKYQRHKKTFQLDNNEKITILRLAPDLFLKFVNITIYLTTLNHNPDFLRTSPPPKITKRIKTILKEKSATATLRNTLLSVYNVSNLKNTEYKLENLILFTNYMDNKIIP